jgi:hypothetical protein
MFHMKHLKKALPFLMLVAALMVGGCTTDDLRTVGQDALGVACLNVSAMDLEFAALAPHASQRTQNNYSVAKAGLVSICSSPVTDTQSAVRAALAAAAAMAQAVVDAKAGR